MTAYSISPARKSTGKRKRQIVPVVAEQVIYLERTQELYSKQRAGLTALYGETPERYTTLTAPAEWLALPPMKVTVNA